MAVQVARQPAKAGWGTEQVGETAGTVWRCLQKLGKTNLRAVERQVGVPESMTHMAIGWLAREGKLDLRQDGRSVEVWLTE